MPDDNGKPTAREFLDMLRGDRSAANHFSEGDPPDLADLDFSDLDQPDDSAASEAAPSGSEAVCHTEDASSDGGIAEAPDAAAAGESADVSIHVDDHLSELFERVNRLLGANQDNATEQFVPQAPESLEQTGLSFDDVERLVLKFLSARGSATGRQISAQIRLPFAIVDPILKQLKQDQLVAFRGASVMGDYEFTITEAGRERARAYSKECTYFGSAPVRLADYLKAMEAQSVTRQHATEEDLKRAFSDLIINRKMLDRLGPAINSGRGMFLYGEPGNGKTSIAERITKCFGSTIWIPRALGIDGEIIRLYDPGIHEEVRQEPNDSGGSIFDLSGVDQRWIRIVRPTVIAGGELTMAELEVTQNPHTKICEAPLQLKSNCGTLVIDDFGRQRMPVDELLNRWIVPLEKRYDFLNLPSGKKVQVPFDQLIIFSTNLEPKDLVDGAFLRRIPYKIEVPDPSEEEFHALFELMAPMMGFTYDRAAIDYLVETHYRAARRPFRACQPRDLLLQVKNYCTYHNLPKVLTREALDAAVENYFSVM